MNGLLSSPLLWYALGFSVIFMLGTTLLMLRNKGALRPLIEERNEDPSKQQEPVSVTVMIPARNEAQSIERCVRSVLKQSRRPDQLLVLDDQSTDSTPAFLDRIRQEDPLLSILDGSDTPENWLGKAWACHRLSQQATGDILVFLDADVWLEPDALESLIAGVQTHHADMITVWPQQTLGTPAERTILPLVYHALVSLLPITYTHRKPKWMPRFLYKRMAPVFAAACGQCLAFRREAYEQIGGHTAVKDEVVEDVELAKRIRSAGLTLRMYEGVRSVHCRMYESHEEIRQGFRKNFFAGFGYSWILFLAAALLHLWVYVAPWILLPLSIYTGNHSITLLAGSLLLLQLLQRGFLAYWFDWSWSYIISHPLGVLWFEYLGILTMIDRLRGKQVRWKGRSV
jgi:chlorobactene glucosyltransferase